MKLTTQEERIKLKLRQIEDKIAKDKHAKVLYEIAKAHEKEMAIINYERERSLRLLNEEALEDEAIRIQNSTHFFYVVTAFVLFMLISLCFINTEPPLNARDEFATFSTHDVSRFIQHVLNFFKYM